MSSMTNEKPTVSRVVNRHIARLMTDLEDANCPVVFRSVVKGRMQWLRDDLVAEFGGDEKMPKIPIDAIRRML
jgi:malate synthase